MLCLVIEFLIPAKRFQKRHASGGKECVGAKDDTDHSHKECLDRRQRLIDGYCDKVPGSKCDHTEYRHKPFRLRFFLSLTASMKQLHRIGDLDLKQVIDQRHDEDRQEENECIHQCICRYLKVHPDIIIQKLKKNEIHKLAKYSPEDDPYADARRSRHQRLNDEHPGYMPFPHAENIVDADLLLPALDQETVGIEQKYNSKYNNHNPGIDQYQVQALVADRRVS